MPLYDYACQQCDRMDEDYAQHDDMRPKPCQCGGAMVRCVSWGGMNVFREEAPWVETCKDVIPKDTKDPTARQFLAEPTRTNLHKWMKANQLRHLEVGEQHANRAMQREREADFERSSVENAMRRLQERRRIEV